VDKLKMHTKNLADENYRKLAELFPDAITETIDEEGNVIRAIDKDVLMQEINTTVVDDKQERYQFTWPDKRKAVILANEPINKTLRLDKEKSVGRDGTPGKTDSENIYIEGDNLDALKLLQETYLGKVKMIYIDPPYNTGNDFIYEDDFSQSASEYAENSGQIDEEGNRMVQNSESNGRFHTDWLNMLYPRLRLAKDLLTEDGVIFISIDDNEQENLKKMCDDIFGAINFVAQIPYIKRVSPANDSKWYSGDHEYVVIYARYKMKWHPHKTERTADHDKYYKNPDNDPRGPWNSAAYTCNKSRSQRPHLYYAITNPNTGEEIYPDENAVWAYSYETHLENVKNNLLYWGADGKSRSPRKKKFLKDADKVVPRSFWLYGEVGSTQTATKDLRDLFGGAAFPYPKPVKLLKKIIYQATEKNDTVLDFFSGSSTTAHAVMQKNAEDGGNRKFILIQLGEKTDEKSEAYKAGYKSICDIGEERIRRAGKKIKEETGADIDYGFRCFKVDSSNMKDVYYNPSSYDQSQLNMFESNIKEGRTGEDFLIQVMLDLGILLSSKVEKKNIEGKAVFSVEDGYLLACFDENLPESLVTEMAKQHPVYAVFRDSGMGSDSLMTNFDQIFKTYSPETVRKVL
jgi:adenine-specific DNA-methyltransferase